MRSFILQNLWGLVIAGIFFVVGIATLSDYGINIDEPTHFMRGNAYLYLYLTGKDTYPSQELQKPRVSAWKIGRYNAHAYIETLDGGHPALGGILAAATNKIFYEQLGWLGDLEAYHAFEIFVSTLLVFLVYVIGRDAYGVLGGTVAAFSVALYPLFWGESHFNIKDPLETALFTATVYFFYRGVAKGKARFFYLSSLFCGLALSTKFNIVFAPLIIVPYLLVLALPWIKKGNLWRLLLRIPKGIYLALGFYPVIVLAIFYATWPYLWKTPIQHTIDTILYYKGIGTGSINQPTYLVNGWNTYPAMFAFASTPPVVLLFAAIGLFAALRLMRQEKDKFSLLLLLWLAVPIVRVTMPGTSIYSGVRQILEYMPPLAVLAGLGASSLAKQLKGYKKAVFIVPAAVLLAFVPLVITLVRLHPNENMYLNQFIGGITGAYKRRIPGTAESLGNVYRQGITWLNQHAETGARLGAPVGLLSNIPMQYLRKDIRPGAVFSGLMQLGEYMIEMSSVDFPPPRYNYNILYLDRYVTPIHEVMVDGVPVLKIWKNDPQHLRPGYDKGTEVQDMTIGGGRDDGFLRVTLPSPVTASRIEITYDPWDCTKTGSGAVNISRDGKTFYTLSEDLYLFQRLYTNYRDFMSRPNTFIYFFPAVKLQIVEFVPNDESGHLCFFQYKTVRLFSLPAEEQP